MTRSFKIFLIAVLPLVAVVACVSCAQPDRAAEKLVSQYPPSVEAPYDFAAVGLVDCGELSIVTFVRSDGKVQPIKVSGPAMLIDIQLRLAQIAYERVEIIENPRECGFVIDDKEIVQ